MASRWDDSDRFRRRRPHLAPIVWERTPSFATQLERGDRVRSQGMSR